ncbi:sulfotransferase domain-containing protein [Nocardioides sp.]|uniref:sulfotransferase domain-containing protein n=1 Tax=Nocardioides sp. TaxID=35761 RepID=UPI003D11C37B
MNLRKMAPDWVQVRGRRLSVAFGKRTVGRRPLPDFLVIGGQRCGTTSLFRALMDHPQIERPTMHKGVNYFDLNYDQGEAWYRAHFPMRAAAADTHVFDASGYYMFHPLAAERIGADLPGIKVIAMVRDPVERAYSAYKHEFARGFEWEKSFERALELEDARLEGEIERMVADPTYASFNHRHHAYRRRGEYARLLEPFIKALGRDNVLVIESESFWSEPEKEYARVNAFLDVSSFVPDKFERYNARPGRGLSPEVRAELEAHFAPHDAALGDLLGHAPVWRSTE